MSANNPNLKDLRIRALAYMDETEVNSHYGKMIDIWLSDAGMEMASGVDGIDAVWSFQATVGQRTYNLPEDWLRMKLVLYNDIPIEEVRIITQNFFSSGTSDVDRYSIWGTPKQIILGPQPPSNAYTIMAYYYRTPRALEKDNDIPDIPVQFRHYLSQYAAAQAMLADGNLQDSQGLVSMYKQGVKEFREWTLYKSRSNFKSVFNEVNYGA